jgi:hypothetical protein
VKYIRACEPHLVLLAANYSRTDLSSTLTDTTSRACLTNELQTTTMQEDEECKMHRKGFHCFYDNKN